VISYADQTDNDLRIAKCNDPACTGMNELNTFADDPPANDVGRESSLAIRDGNPVISHWDIAAGALKVTKCAIKACTP